MDKYKETYQTWNNIAALYQDKFMDLDIYNDTYDYICNAIKNPKSKLLEIGCGPGNITKYLLTKRPDFEIFGIDIAPNMIELAKQNNPTAKFEVMDSRAISTLEEKFDGIVVGFCLPYLSPKDTTELITKAYNLLNEKGLLYLSFVEGEPEKSEFKVGSGCRVFFYYHDLENVKTQLSNSKFKESTIFKVPTKISETEFDIQTVVNAKKEI